MQYLSLIPLVLLPSPITPGPEVNAAQDSHLLSTREQYVLRVCDYEDSTPIVGALAWASYSLGGEHFALPETITNIHGEAAFDLTEIRKLRPIEQASVELEFHAARSGYTTGDHWASAGYRDGHETLGERDEDSMLLLDAGRSVIGRVLDSLGEPVCEAHVVAGVWDPGAGEWGGESGGYYSWTDATGRFSIDLEDDPIRDLVASHHRAGAVATQVAPGSLEGLPVGGIEITLQRPEFVLRGTLLGPSGESLGRPSLSVWHDGEPRSPYALDHDVPVAEDGSFEAACPVGGVWQVGAYEYAEPWAVVPGTGDVHLHAPRFHAVIRVVDESGQPVRSQSLRFHRLRVTSAGLRPDYLGQLGDETTFMRWSGSSAESTGGGVWTCRLQHAGPYSVSLFVPDGERAWFAETTVRVDESNPVVEHTLVLREASRAGPIEITFVDENDQPVPAWSGGLHSLLTGLKSDEFTEKGTPFFGCWGTSHAPLSWLTGTYRLRLRSAPGHYTLPVEAEITVHAGTPNRFKLQSPGTGGRLIFTSTKNHTVDDAWVTVELVRAAAEEPVQRCYLYRTRGTSDLRWAPTQGARFGSPSRLLEPGEWRWRVFSNEGVLRAGTVDIQPGKDVALEIDLAD